MSNDKAKRAAGYKAAELVKDGMKVGLGTGSTAYYFIEKLIEKTKSGLKIKGIATSQKSTLQAQKGGIELLDPSKVDFLDLDVDGADEIDPHKQMIKGGGGALFREKIIASASGEMIVVIDESKQVEKLGRHPLPIEIAPFGLLHALKKIKELGLDGKIRKKDEEIYLTDNQNYIFDANVWNYPDNLKQLDKKILEIPGVIETGFFWDLAKRVVIGYEDGRAEIKG